MKEIECKVVIFEHTGNYPHRIKGVSKEDFQIIKNFLNSVVSYTSGSEIGYSHETGGDCISDVEWKLLYDNAELLGIKFIVEEV